jgi:hypothetical protein
LVALSVALSALIAATIVAAFTASIPYVGVGVSIAMGVSAAATGIALAVISSTLLPALDQCLVDSTGATASDAVAIQRVVGTVAGVIVVAFGLQAGLGFGVPTPIG